MDEKALNEMQNNRERVDLSPLGIPQVEKKELSIEERKANMKKVMEMYKRQYLHRYNIEGIDLEAELKLINEKKSNLSRSQREAVVGYFMIFLLLMNVWKRCLSKNLKSKTSENLRLKLILRKQPKLLKVRISQPHAMNS